MHNVYRIPVKLQLWESMLSLTIPDDKEIIERWNKTMTAVIKKRVIEVYTCIFICLSVSTSAKIIQLNEYGCRDAPCEKSWKQGNPLSNTIKDTSTIMRNPFPELCREGCT